MTLRWLFISAQITETIVAYLFVSGIFTPDTMAFTQIIAILTSWEYPVCNSTLKIISQMDVRVASMRGLIVYSMKDTKDVEII